VWGGLTAAIGDGSGGFLRELRELLGVQPVLAWLVAQAALCQ
jgi:hypothetical protein